MRKFLTILTIIMVLIGCRKAVIFGQKPKSLESEIPYEAGKLFLEDEGLEVRYVITDNRAEGQERGDDIIFYFHGIFMSELEWVEEGGFGSRYHNLLFANTQFASNPVVSISLGGAFLFVDDAPRPFDADLERVFIEKVVPHFREMLGVSGKNYLLGHSLGGYNALTLSLRNPEKFPLAVAISPYTAPISPFKPDFDLKGEELNMTKSQVRQLKRMLTSAYGTKENWDLYNPFELLKGEGPFPRLIMSAATEDLPGFNWAIKLYSEALNERGVEHSFCEAQGDHKATCELLFYTFMKEIGPSE